jgi:hypothetical protein
MNDLLKPEFGFLCSLVRPCPDHRRALEFARNGLNWADVERLAAAHGVRPRLVSTLNSSASAGKFGQLRRALQQFRRGHVARNLHAAGELGRIANSFDQRGIDFATFKGIALAETLYGDISRREFNDIDIIVRPSDLEAAESALESCGYRAALGSSREWRKAFLSYQRQYAFVRPDSKFSIDLHWDFSSQYFAFPLRESDIWSKLDHVQIAGRAIPTLNGETLAIYLVGHGAKEGWKSLGWICDFADFYRLRPDIDWADLSRRLDAGGRGCLLLGLLLTRELLGVPVEGELLKDASHDSEIRSLFKFTLRRLSSAAESKNPHPEMSLDYLESCRSWGEKTRVFWLLATTRTVSDYNAIPLPWPVWRLYHLIRPFRLAAKTLTCRPARRPRPCRRAES